MEQKKDKNKKKSDPLEEVINLMLRTQAKTCVRARKLLEEKEKDKK